MDYTAFSINPEDTGAGITSEIEAPELAENAFDYASIPYPATPAEFSDVSDFIDKTLEEQRCSDDINASFLDFFYGNGNLDDNVDYSELPSQPQSEVIVAPAIVHYTCLEQGTSFDTLPGPVMSPAPVHSSRRKSGQGRRFSSGDDTPVFVEAVEVKPDDAVDVKPSEAVLVLQLQQQRVSTRGKKRAQPVESPSDLQAQPSGKRVKKYLLSDEQDPSARNARAAKLNRDKKKKERLDMIAEVTDLKAQLTTQSQENIRLKSLNLKLAMELSKLRHQNQSANGIFQVRDDLTRFLGSVVPALGQSGFPVPQITLAPEFIPPQVGRSITAQYNLDLNSLTVSCPGTPAPAPGVPKLWTGQVPLTQ